ncbi:MAG: hypothetical protein EA425_00530 [Puniceicoccaceae bacterium]|nr:MAG: hypothetical protein EA425_00530 [Puniceicoccaceae bacterium]
MSGIQLTGLASGFDWKSVVDQLMELQRLPINRLRVEQQANSRQLTGFSDLTAKLGDLQTSLNTFSGDNLFARKVASVGGGEANGWTAAASPAATAGSYGFDILKVATASVREGATNVSRPLSESDDVSELTIAMGNLGMAVGAGEITVNGERVTVDPSESFQDLFDRIESATGGEVTARYDADSDRIVLESDSEIVLGSAADSSNFLQAAKLFNNGTGTVASHGALGSLDQAETLASARLATEITAVDGEGTGAFSINGVEFEYNLGEDRIKDIVQRVNASAAGVELIHNPAEDRFSLRNTVTGDLGMALSEAEGGLLAALGLTGPESSLQRGDNTEFRVDGGNIRISQSNTLNADAHGIAGLNLTVGSAGNQTVEIASDSEAVREQVDEFVSRYNAVQELITRQTRVETGNDGEVNTSIFSGNREIGSLSRDLRNAVFVASEIQDVGVRRLQNYGVDFARGTNRLEVRDESVLTDAISNRPDELRDLFMTSGTGLVDRLKATTDRFISANGTAPRQSERLQARNQDLDRQIGDIERRLLQQRKLMESQFLAMEQAQSRIQQQMGNLLRMFES